MQQDQSDVLGPKVGADWCFYNPYMRTRISKRKYHALQQSPLPICPASHPAGFDHDIEILKWVEDEGSVVCDDGTRGEEGYLSQLVGNNNADAGQVSYDKAYSDVAVTGGNQAGSNVDWTAIILEFMQDVGHSKSNLSLNLSEMWGYLRGRLEL